MVKITLLKIYKKKLSVNFHLRLLSTNTSIFLPPTKNPVQTIFPAQKKRYCKQILHTVAFFRYKFSFFATNDYFVK